MLCAVAVCNNIFSIQRDLLKFRFVNCTMASVSENPVLVTGGSGFLGSWCVQVGACIRSV